MPPPGYEPFLAEILARPSEDVPRLVFADWLEEHGDPRGEFIRIQCQRENMTPADPGFERLSDRESTLLNEFGPQWCVELPEWARAGCEFSRGFADRVHVWHRHHFPSLNDLRTLAPIQSLAIHDIAGAMDQFLATNVLDWLPALVLLDSRAGIDEWKQLLRLNDDDADGVPDGVLVRRLSAIGLQLLDAAGVVLKTKAALPNLEHLELIRCGWTARGVEMFADTTRLPKLENLDLSENVIGNAGVWHLSLAPNRARLRRLSLRATDLSNDGIKHLTEAKFAGSLQMLDVSGNRLTDDGAFHLAGAFPNLKWLCARNCYFTTRGLSQLQQRFGTNMQV